MAFSISSLWGNFLVNRDPQWQRSLPFYSFGIVTNAMVHFEGIAGIQDYKLAGPITASISDAYGRSIYKYID
jgi:hypothetical protein